MSMDLFNAKAMAAIFAAAVDHHDPSKPEVTHDLDALARRAAGLDSGGGFMKTLLNTPASAQLIATLLAALVARLTPQPAQPAQPQIGPTPTSTTTTPEAIVWPVSLTVDLDLFLGDELNTPCPYRVEEREDCYEVIKTDGTTNLPIHGGAYLHAGYIGPDGKGIQFEPGSKLDHTAIWVASRVGNERASVWCGPGKPAAEGGTRVVANFWLKEYERTRGMDAQVKFPPSANDTVVEIALRVDTPNGPILSKPVRFPKVS